MAIIHRAHRENRKRVVIKKLSGDGTASLHREVYEQEKRENEAAEPSILDLYKTPNYLGTKVRYTEHKCMFGLRKYEHCLNVRVICGYKIEDCSRIVPVSLLFKLPKER